MYVLCTQISNSVSRYGQNTCPACSPLPVPTRPATAMPSPHCAASTALQPEVCWENERRQARQGLARLGSDLHSLVPLTEREGHHGWTSPVCSPARSAAPPCASESSPECGRADAFPVDSRPGLPLAVTWSLGAGLDFLRLWDEIVLRRERNVLVPDGTKEDGDIG